MMDQIIQTCIQIEQKEANDDNHNNPTNNNTNNSSKNDVVTDKDDRNPKLERYFMKKALEVAKKALAIGEVPVGCVIVLRCDLFYEEVEEDILKDMDASISPIGRGSNDDTTHTNNSGSSGSHRRRSNLEKNELSSCTLEDSKSTYSKQNKEQNYNNNDKDDDGEEKHLEEIYKSSLQVIVSHGANQVNATRDATRHAECIAIDRMITGGLVSDKMRLPKDVYMKKKTTKNLKTNDADDEHTVNSLEVKVDDDCYEKDEWINVPSDTNHWKNSYGWGSGKLYKQNIFQKCDLYVTCEPCIMVSYE